MSHVSHRNESCLICKWVMCGVWMSHVSCMHMGILLCLCPCGRRIYLGPTYMNGSCLTREWVKSHVCRRESCLTYEWVMSYIWMINVSCMNESCHTYEWVKSHVCMSHVSCITYLIRHSLTYSTRDTPPGTTPRSPHAYFIPTHIFDPHSYTGSRTNSHTPLETPSWSSRTHFISTHILDQRLMNLVGTYFSSSRTYFISTHELDSSSHTWLGARSNTPRWWC